MCSMQRSVAFNGPFSHLREGRRNDTMDELPPLRLPPEFYHNQPLTSASATMSTSQQEDPSSPRSQASLSPRWKGSPICSTSDIHPPLSPQVSVCPPKTLPTSPSLDHQPAQAGNLRVLPLPAHRQRSRHHPPGLPPSASQHDNFAHGRDDIAVYYSNNRKSQSTSAIPSGSPSLGHLSSDIETHESSPEVLGDDTTLPSYFKRRVKSNFVRPSQDNNHWLGKKNDVRNSPTLLPEPFVHQQSAYQGRCQQPCPKGNSVQCLCENCDQSRKHLVRDDATGCLSPGCSSENTLRRPHPVGPTNSSRFSARAKRQQRPKVQPQHAQPQHMHVHVHHHCPHGCCKDVGIPPIERGTDVLGMLEHQFQYRTPHGALHNPHMRYPQPSPFQEDYPQPMSEMQQQNPVMSHGAATNAPAALSPDRPQQMNTPPSSTKAPITKLPSGVISSAKQQAAEEFKIPPPPLEILRSKCEVSVPVPRPVSTNDNFVPSGRRLALIVGIEYTFTEWPLKGCASDVRQVYSLVRHFFGFLDEEIVILCDVPTGLESVVKHGPPTHQEILHALHLLVSNTQPGDSLWFSFSGHGRQLKDENGDEIVDGLDESLVPVDYQTSGDIIDDDIYPIVTSICPGSRMTALIDACHSGALRLHFSL